MIVSYKMESLEMAEVSIPPTGGTTIPPDLPRRDSRYI